MKEIYTEEKCNNVTTYTSATEKVKDPSIIGEYYELATDFYEFGWGKSFHFCPIKPGEKRADAMWAYEKRMIDCLGLKPGMKVLDVGCGRGSWAGDACTIRRRMRNLQGEGRMVIGIDVDTAAADNASLDEFRMIDDVSRWPVADAAVHVAVSDFVMEHVERPWEWLKNLTTYLNKNALICIIAPHTFEEHRYPIDTYRYLPDGMRDLFKYANIDIVDILNQK